MAILSEIITRKHNSVETIAQSPLVYLSTAVTEKRRYCFFFLITLSLPPPHIILNHQGVKYNKALYRSICRLYLTGVLQVNIPLAREK